MKKVKGKRQKAADSGLACPSIGKFKVKQLHAAGYNPRVISAEALEGLSHSIKRFGCVEPIVVNTRGKKNTIIGGHQRFKALMALGVAECLCVTVDCSKADEKLLNLTLNNPQIQGAFSKNIAEHIEKLQGEMPDGSDFLSLRITALQSELGILPEQTGNIPDDDVPKPPKKAITRPGEMWILGKHRMLCGDSTKKKDVTRLMGRQKASLFATDPPYIVEYHGDDRPQAGKDWSDTYKDIPEKEAITVIESFYKHGLSAAIANVPCYLWHADVRRSLYISVCSAMGLHVHQTIIWVKPCLSLGYSVYPRRHEPCLFMWKKTFKPTIIGRNVTNKVTTVWPVGFQRTGDPTTPEYYTDVWDLDYAGKGRPTGIDHPTIKPVEVFAIPMRVHTKPGDICYEPFCGSGTQIIAAEKLERRCFAMEKEPLFVDVAVKRWEQWTGKKARRVRRGR